MICLVSALLLSACAEWDLIGRGSVEAFERVLYAGERLTGLDVVVSDSEWSHIIYMPDNITTFGWSREPEGYFSLSMAFDGAPFVEAGLNTNELPSDIVAMLMPSLIEGSAPIFTIIVSTGLDDITSEYKGKGEGTSIAAFEQVLYHHPEIIGYHDAGHHYMLHFGDTGNMLMFARDVTTQAAGMMFMLNPQPFIDAGADVNNIDGWAYGPRETMNSRGQTVTEYFLVKTFDLR